MMILICNFGDFGLLEINVVQSDKGGCLHTTTGMNKHDSFEKKSTNNTPITRQKTTLLFCHE